MMPAPSKCVRRHLADTAAQRCAAAAPRAETARPPAAGRSVPTMESRRLRRQTWLPVTSRLMLFNHMLLGRVLARPSSAVHSDNARADSGSKGAKMPKTPGLLPVRRPQRRDIRPADGGRGGHRAATCSSTRNTHARSAIPCSNWPPEPAVWPWRWLRRAWTIVGLDSSEPMLRRAEARRAALPAPARDKSAVRARRHGGLPSRSAVRPGPGGVPLVPGAYVAGRPAPLPKRCIHRHLRIPTDISSSTCSTRGWSGACRTRLRGCQAGSFRHPVSGNLVKVETLRHTERHQCGRF